jgi:multidrug transporter EmrE-like cation transporter
MAAGSYYSPFKNSPWYFPVGLGAAIVANFIWMSIAKEELDTSALVIKGVTWDAMLIMCYVLVPILFFETKFTTIQASGILLTVIGLFMTKL